jgi:HEAT repeat protein
MQCRALTAARQRCPDAAAPDADYCAAHAQFPARITGRASNGNGRHGALGRVLNSIQVPLGLDPMRRAPQDGSRYDVPGWLWNASTAQVIDRLLHDDDSMVRWLAAYTLRKRRALEAIEPLWQVLRQEPVRLVRQQAAVALGKIGTPAVFSPLVEALNYDRDQGVRQACAIALGNLGYPGAVDELARALESETSPFVRWDCVVALGQLGGGEVEPLLAQLEDEEIAEAIRRACRDARAEIKTRTARA